MAPDAKLFEEALLIVTANAGDDALIRVIRLPCGACIGSVTVAATMPLDDVRNILGTSGSSVTAVDDTATLIACVLEVTLQP